MPRREEVVPWGATQAAVREPYPRKNVYFVGRQMEEVYNYCIWQAHVDGHVTLSGKRVRGASGFILDVLTRCYLEAMLDPDKLASFQQWCAQRTPDQSPRPAPHPLLLAIRKNLQLLPKRSELKGSMEEWKLSSREYQLLHRFCRAFNEIYGQVYIDDRKDDEQVS